MLRHLRLQVALAAGGLLVIAGLLYGVSRQAFEQRPARGGQLVEGLVGRPATFSPLYAVDDAEVDVVRLVFAGLTRADAQGRIVPDIATRWSASPDGRVYTFTLRTDALWHDGAPVTAEDVRLTAELAADESLALKSPLAAPWERASVDVVDSHTVRLTLEEPYAPFLQATTLGLLPAHLLYDVRPAELLNHRFSTLEPIGCGPYRLLQPGGLIEDEVRLVRWDGHWDSTDERPYLDELGLRLFDTRAEALQALAEHDIQALAEVPADAFTMLGEESRLHTAVEAGYTLVYLNPANAIFTDEAVRRALSLGLDREGIIHDPTLLNGQGVSAASPIPPGSWAFDPSVRPVKYDPQAASELLEGAGWVDSDGDGVRDKDARNLTFSLETNNDPLMVAIADRIAAGWAEIGVEAMRRSLDQRATVSNLSNRAFDAMLFGWERRDYDPDPYPLWHSSQADDGQNFAGWRNAEADALMLRARRAHPEDIEGRAALYHEFQRLFIQDEPALMLYHRVFAYVVVEPSLGGIQLPQLLVEPADRFLTLPSWFVQTERVFRGSRPEHRSTATPDPNTPLTTP